MAISIIDKKIRKLKRRMRKNETKVYMMVGVLVLGLVSYIGLIAMNRNINPTVYKPLLHLIAEAESNGNYNAHFGNAGNEATRFTDMTIQEVMSWQADFVAAGSVSSAVGRYQIIDSTLVGLVNEMELDTSLKFDESMQDAMAIKLLERRGAEDYIRGHLTAEQFAANIAMEWAALPKVTGEDPNQSYYAGDGLNYSRITRDQVLAAIETITV